ncbi:MAG: T9SS type A sorting domain-containing protein [Crocinitomix sp.]|nr:T9SS type A sorting domain-containing protein [Crocinitomix sp.]
MKIALKKSKIYSVIAFVCFFLGTASFSIGQTWDEVIKLTASDASENDWFGNSVSISGQQAIVGAKLNDDDGAESGAVYIFQLEGDTWVEVQKLTAMDAAEYDNFGTSVAISGERAIVGANLNDDDGSNSGAAYIFELVGDTWVEIEKLTASDAAESDEFGSSVSISGDRVIIGAYFNDDEGLSSGSAYIFEVIGDSWVETQKLTPADAEENIQFGIAVSISGERAIVGARQDSDDALYSGSAYIFELAGDTWVEVEKLTASDAAAVDEFANSVCISGDRAIIGSRYNDDDGDDSGSAYIFELVGDTWVETQKLTASDATTNDYFGFSVSIFGDRAIVGAYQNDDSGSNSGSAYIFNKVGDTWVEIEKITASDAAAGDAFGLSVSISSDQAIIGAWRASEDDRGAAYIFEDSSLGIDKLDFNNITVFPNPTSDQVTIELEGEFTYSLLALNGKILSTTKAVNRVSLDLSEFATGIYFLEIQSENLSKLVKLVKQ